MTAKIAGMLEELGRTHFVELTTTWEDGIWSLTVTRRDRAGYAAHSYRGTLAEVVARAHAGDEPDGVSR